MPYFLPRTPEWSGPENLQFRFRVEGHQVDVRPRRQDEDLFPRPIDEELSRSTLEVKSDHIVPVGAPTEINVRDLCYDRLEVHVYGEVASRYECMTRKIRPPFDPGRGGPRIVGDGVAGAARYFIA